LVQSLGEKGLAITGTKRKLIRKRKGSQKKRRIKRRKIFLVFKSARQVF